VIIVKGSEGLIGFCGGIDINPDRIGGFDTNNQPMAISGFDENGLPKKIRFSKSETLEILHDVHCRVKGRGAYYLLQRFLERWKNFKSLKGSLYPIMNTPLKGESEPLPNQSNPGTGISNVKILHT